MVKLYPGYLAVLTAYVVIALLMPELSKIPHDPAPAIAYVLANLLLLPGLLPITPIVTVAWSLSYVAFGYVFIGALYVLSAGRGWSLARRLWLWSFVAILILGASEFAGFPTGGCSFSRWAHCWPKFRRSSLVPARGGG
jgi:hypothetical protein